MYKDIVAGYCAALTSKLFLGVHNFGSLSHCYVIEPTFNRVLFNRVLEDVSTCFYKTTEYFNQRFRVRVNDALRH